jgi:hypothetical protein
VTDQPTTPPAGWYADPGGSGELRWWDGAAWTPHTHADPAAGSTAGSTAGTPTTTSTSSTYTPTPSSAPTPGPAAEVPWWAQSGDGKPPSWWADGTTDQRNAWNAANAVGDRKGPADPSAFGVPGAVPESGAAPMANPYAYTHVSRPMARADGAVKALVLGIVSLFCCGIIIGPIAIYEGTQVRYRVRTSNGRLDGDGFGIAAIVLGIIATLFSVIGIILYATGHHALAPTTGR